MKRLMLLVAVAAFLAAGCQNDYYARRIIQPSDSMGQLALDLTGTDNQLAQSGRIDLHRRIKGSDNINIDTWVIRAQKSDGQTQPKGTVVVLHGLGQSKAAFPYFGTAERLSKRGYDAVLLDLRAHGRSDGKYITYGAHEKLDVRAVVDNLLADGQIHEPIYVFGANLGGATAIQYAAIDSRVRGVVAVAPLPDARSVGWQISKVRDPMMTTSQYSKVLARAGEMAGFNPDDASTIKAAAHCQAPLLIIQGLLDLSTPLPATQEIYDAAAGPKKLLVPTVEELLLPAVLEDWFADCVDKLASEGLKSDSPQPQAATAPATSPAPPAAGVGM